jgi:hypothetical protein
VTLDKSSKNLCWKNQ